MSKEWSIRDFGKLASFSSFLFFFSRSKQHVIYLIMRSRKRHPVAYFINVTSPFPVTTIKKDPDAQT
jgi:hypothetical protein